MFPDSRERNFFISEVLYVVELRAGDQRVDQLFGGKPNGLGLHASEGRAYRGGTYPGHIRNLTARHGQVRELRFDLNDFGLQSVFLKHFPFNRAKQGEAADGVARIGDANLPKSLLSMGRAADDNQPD
jgi:hypothetical protein